MLFAIRVSLMNGTHVEEEVFKPSTFSSPKLLGVCSAGVGLVWALFKLGDWSLPESLPEDGSGAGDKEVCVIGGHDKLEEKPESPAAEL